MPKRPDRRSAFRPPVSDHAAPTEHGAGWLRYKNLKVEAAIFLLIVVTFAAVLGKSALTRQSLTLTPRSSQVLAYTFSDAQTGGRSSVVQDQGRPMAWTCEIRTGADYPFCGYGLLTAVGAARDGLDFSRFQTITLRLRYQGTGSRLKLQLKTAPPAALGARLGGQDTPLALEFPVVRGFNEIRLPLSQLTAESWWVISHGLTADEMTPELAHVRAVAVTTDDARAGPLAVSIEAITFEGVSLSDEQWYLLILGVWLVVTGGFLMVRLLGMRRDYEIGRRRQAEEARVLSEARAAAEAANAAKSQFLSHMSHELRTPLNAVIGYSYWLSRGPLEPKQRTAVDAIRSSGEHLLAVITDILDIAKIEAGRLDLQPAAFDLRACLDDMDRMFRLRAEEKGLAFTVELAAGAPSTIVADPKRLRQVLINLLGNAVKFTDEGRVSLVVEPCEALAGEPARLRFTVEDTGVGIDPDQLEAVFRPFEQVGDASRHAGGTGLGLSITRQIVETMGGEIQLDSTPGLGSCFVVETPVGVETAAEAPVGLQA